MFANYNRLAPSKKIEALWYAGRTKLEDDAFELIVKAKEAIVEHAKDDMPDVIWEGVLAVLYKTEERSFQARKIWRAL